MVSNLPIPKLTAHPSCSGTSLYPSSVLLGPSNFLCYPSACLLLTLTVPQLHAALVALSVRWGGLHRNDSVVEPSPGSNIRRQAPLLQYGKKKPFRACFCILASRPLIRHPPSADVAILQLLNNRSHLYICLHLFGSGMCLLGSVCASACICVYVCVRVCV